MLTQDLTQKILERLEIASKSMPIYVLIRKLLKRKNS